MAGQGVLIDVFVLFAASQVAAHVMRRFRQPAVIGEILAGVLVGPHLLGWVSGSEFIHSLAEIGVIILLFYVGLGTRVSDLLRVGRHSLAAGTLGVLFPLVAGVLLMSLLGYPPRVAYFMGAALVATSVGITARVLVDMHQSHTRPARVILGAAVYDDILGLLILAVVVGMAANRLSLTSLVVTVAQALAFTVFVVLLGQRMVHRFSVHVPAFQARSPEFVLAMIICLGLSALASLIGLASLVGAFLAGMVLSETREAQAVRQRVEPVYDLLVPLFFATMGTLVNVPAMLNPQTALLALAITALAVVTKFAGCGLAALPLGRREALIVGVGMIPRGEVGIVVAMIGLKMGVVTQDLYGVVVTMSLATTLLAPPLLWRLMPRHRHEQPPEAAPAPATE